MPISDIFNSLLSGRLASFIVMGGESNNPAKPERLSGPRGDPARASEKTPRQGEGRGGGGGGRALDPGPATRIRRIWPRSRLPERHYCHMVIGTNPIPSGPGVAPALWTGALPCSTEIQFDASRRRPEHQGILQKRLNYDE